MSQVLSAVRNRAVRLRLSAARRAVFPEGVSVGRGVWGNKTQQDKQESQFQAVNFAVSSLRTKSDAAPHLRAQQSSVISSFCTPLRLTRSFTSL